MWARPWGEYAQGAAAGWFASVIGAVVLLVIYSLVKKQRLSQPCCKASVAVQDAD